MNRDIAECILIGWTVRKISWTVKIGEQIVSTLATTSYKRKLISVSDYVKPIS
jgi:hypothetical protein